MSMKNSINCEHERFSGHVDVGRIVDKGEFVVTVQVHCVECGLPFLFDEDHFAVTGDRRTLRYKIKPQEKALAAAIHSRYDSH